MENIKLGKTYSKLEEKIFLSSRSGNLPKRIFSYETVYPLFDKKTGEFVGYSDKLEIKKYDLISKKIIEIEHEMMVNEINYKNRYKL